MSYVDTLQYRLQSSSKGAIVYYAGLVIISIGLIITTIMGAIHVHSTYTSYPVCNVEGPSPYQLPRNVIPLSYKLHLQPNMVNFLYNGTVDIKLQVNSRTKCIVLNYEDLNIEKKNIVLTDSSSSKIKLEELTLNNTETKVFMKFARMFEVGEQLNLHIAFNGKLREDLQGFYKSSYVTSTGETKVIATTQFESESARTAFPCFDEPNFKANFQVSIQVSSAVATTSKVLSNMPEEKRTVLPDGSVTVLFQETPKISTYLLAYIIGEFDYVEAVSEDIVFRVYSLPGDGPKGQFMLDIAQQVTKVFNEYFGIKYPLPKMDLIGIPDFRAGAMENIGLITFRSSYLVVDNQTTQSLKEGGAEVVSHEIAHQWSGNLVTTNWWSHIWLNEGFATFFETYALDKVRPEWKRWEAKLTNSIQYALAEDALSSTHPIVNSALSPDEVEAVFDTITYDKGGAFLLMVYHYLGEETFQSWMREYFATYKFNNTVTDQLFQVLESVSKNEGIAQKFSTWVFNAGFPLITVKKDSGNTYTISQARFYSNKPDGNTTNTEWWVPISILHSGGSVKNVELSSTSSKISIDAGSKWFKLNRGQTGFYRVNYPSENWLALFDDIENLSTNDKFGVIDDSFALTFSGDLSIKLTLKLLPYLKDENTFAVWDTVFTHLNRIYQLIAREPIGEHFTRAIQDLIKDKYEELGWDMSSATDSNDKMKLRALMLSQATFFNLEDAVEKAEDLFWEGGVIDPNIRQTVYKSVVTHGGEKAYYAILERFNNTTDVQEFNRLMYALAWAQNPALIKNTLELTLGPKIRSQDTVYLIREVSRNPYGRDLAWEFAREYYDLIVSKAGQRTVSARLVTGVTSSFSSKVRYNEVKEFFAPKQLPSLDTALNAIVTNEKFLRASYNDLKAYLEENFAFTQ